MAASFFASFVIFILIGVYSLHRGLAFTTDTFVKAFVSVALLFNAIFYHYAACYTEMNVEVRKKLEGSSRFEWLIRVINQCVLLSLWFWLDQGWDQFGVALYVLYGSFLLWDFVTWRHFANQHKLFWFDLAGTVMSVIYVQAGSVVTGKADVSAEVKNTFYFMFGVLSLAYLALPVAGMLVVKFNPFQARYMSRPGLR
jgi:uncharacterized membrane protein